MAAVKNDSFSESTGLATSQPKPKHGPVQLACISCRARHLKCDARVPVCGRCQTEAHECHYVRSRRGYKGPRRVKRAPNEEGNDGASVPRDMGNTVPIDLDVDFYQTSRFSAAQATVPTSVSYNPRLSPKTCPLLAANAFNHLLSLPPDYSPDKPLQLLLSTSTSPSSALTYHTTESLRSHLPTLLCKTGIEATAMTTYLIGLYYQNFHQGHPILLPRRLLPTDPALRPACLELTMMIIGSHYTPDAAAFRTSAVDHLLAHELPRAPTTVQVYLLLFLALHGQNEQILANTLLERAVVLALDLGMNRKSFAVMHGEGKAHLEESWRRTWWELYTASIMLAALHQLQSFRLRDVETDVGLPCEERFYQHEDYIPIPKTISQFQDRAFNSSSSSVEFSSYAYRIDAAKCLASVLALGKDVDSDDQDRVEAVDASLSAWFLHLPQSKREILDGCAENSFDEMLFQAHMIIYSAQIYLHRSRSSLHLAPATPPPSSTFCGRAPPPSAPITTPHTHTIKTLRAANALSSLAALVTPVTTHSPFFICATVLSAIVQIAAASAGFDAKGSGVRGRNLLPRIQASVGVLSEVGGVWEVARDVVGQVRSVARGLVGIGMEDGMGEVSDGSVEAEIEVYGAQDFERVGEKEGFEGLGEKAMGEGGNLEFDFDLEGNLDVEGMFKDDDAWMRFGGRYGSGGLNTNMGMGGTGTFDWGEGLVA